MYVYNYNWRGNVVNDKGSKKELFLRGGDGIAVLRTPQNCGDKHRPLKAFIHEVGSAQARCCGRGGGVHEMGAPEGDVAESGESELQFSSAQVPSSSRELTLVEM